MVDPNPASHVRPRGRTGLVPWIAVAAVLLGAGWGSNQFTPLLLVYRHSLELGTGTLEAMFGVYALGLLPGLLVAGPLSDARGRRRIVTVAAGLSLASSLVMMAGANSVTLLFVGRFVAGLSSGAAFAAGTAWLREVSLPPIGAADHGTAARRAAVAMTAGFALGPLLAGLLAQWAPAPTVVPYLPHALLMIVVLGALTNVPETVVRGVRGPGRRLRVVALGLQSPRFRRVIAPVAPWVFAAPAIAFAFLPTIIGADRAAEGIAVSAAVTAVTALAGMLIGPLARRLEARASNRAGVVGLTLLGAGLILAGATAQAEQIWMLVPSGILLGSAYGLCLVSGLAEVQRIADQDSVGALTAAYYALAYLGFAAPFLLTLAARLVGYPVLLVIAAVLPLATAVQVVRAATRLRPPRLAS